MAKRKSTKVMGFGTFDGIHPGHMDFFRQLKDLGDEVCIVVARDRNIEKIKGRLPRFDESLRFKELEQIKLIDKVVLGDDEDFYKPVSDYQPDVIGLGYDQKADEDALKKRFPDAKVVRLEGFEPERHKSSILNGR